jgi:hypothetical protein
MTRTVWEAAKLNVWLAWVSSTRVEEVVVTTVDEVTTYLLLKARSVCVGTGNHNATIRRESIVAVSDPLLFENLPWTV